MIFEKPNYHCLQTCLSNVFPCFAFKALRVKPLACIPPIPPQRPHSFALFSFGVFFVCLGFWGCFGFFWGFLDSFFFFFFRNADTQTVGEMELGSRRHAELRWGGGGGKKAAHPRQPLRTRGKVGWGSWVFPRCIYKCDKKDLLFKITKYFYYR